MNKEIIFLTENKEKIDSARAVFDLLPNITLKNVKLSLPEIQSMDVEEVVRYSVSEAVKILNAPVFKVDCGYYFEGLNNFPGALVKYFNQSFSTEDILKILEGKSRKVIIRECLAYAEPEKKIKTFVVQVTATIAETPMGDGGSIDRLVIYEGFDKPQAACDYNDIVKYWNKTLTHYKQLAEYLRQ